MAAVEEMNNRQHLSRSLPSTFPLQCAPEGGRKTFRLSQMQQELLIRIQPDKQLIHDHRLMKR
jgi:hypothetical protein